MTSRLMRLLALVVSVAMIGLVGGVTVGTATAAPPPGKGNNTNTVKVTGTGPNGVKFNGQFTWNNTKTGPAENPGVDPVDPQTGAVAVGQLTGKLINPGQGQNTAQDVSQNVEMPISALQATCQVLDLTLGPLHLNLLGLIVDLNQVHLTITADPNGGLLGSLLCSLAGGPTGGPLVDLLNQVLQALLGLLGG